MTRRHVVVPYPASNSTVRTRALHWIDRLAAEGLLAPEDVVVHGPGFAEGRVPPHEPVHLVRNARRVTRGRHEARLLRRAAPGVYDLDDGLPWDDGTLPSLGRWWKRPFPRSLLARRAAAAADRLIVGNEVLAEWAALHCGDVRLIPTCVEPDEYVVRTAWELGEVPLIGWIGSPATEPYLLDLAAVLAEVHHRTGAMVEIISGGDEVPAALAGFTTMRRWHSGATAEIAAWDVGIMPLRDGPYERAKCGYKLLQYAASGVPAVGAPVGVNATLLRGMDGLAPRSQGEWVDALCEVLTEPAARRRQRAASGLAVADSYSYAAWQSAWIDAVGRS
jgi:glycosyltransferase involved in cell wall biosynthesis